MQCITYGWAIVYIIILQIIVSILAAVVPGAQIKAIILGAGMIGHVIILLYWLSGFFSSCPDGILGCP